MVSILLSVYKSVPKFSIHWNQNSSKCPRCTNYVQSSLTKMKNSFANKNCQVCSCCLVDMENTVVICSLAVILVVVSQINFLIAKLESQISLFFFLKLTKGNSNNWYHYCFYSNYQWMSQSEGEELSSKNEDLEKESSSQGASHKFTADMKPIGNLKLVKQV